MLEAQNTHTVSHAVDDDHEEFLIPLLFRDGLDQPIQDLQVFVGLPEGELAAITSDAGAVTITFAVDSTAKAPVNVLDATGQRQQVCELDLAQCTHAVIIRSPKVVVGMPLRPHQQTLPPAPKASAPAVTPKAAANPTAPRPQKVDLSVPWWQANSAQAKALKKFSPLIATHTLQAGSNPAALHGLTTSGNPVTLVAAPECPNKDNLVLGKNNVYREAILGAAKRLGLIPQAICALIDCEAAKVPEHIALLGKDGKPLKDKQGKVRTRTVREVWKADSGNAQSGAAGLTQFLGSTWLGHVLIPGYYIHDESKKAGWVRLVDVPKHGKQWMFVLADGKTTATPYGRRQDANVKACLAMRMDPTWSVNAAADYGTANLKLLKAKGFTLDGLGDMDKAKLMYLMHHEGEGAGPAFISDTLAPTAAAKVVLRSKFVQQLGGNGASLADGRIDSAGNDVEIAYRDWFATFVDGKFTESRRFFCSSPAACNSLSDLSVLVGGKKIHAVD